jgi:hypothetical protein
MAAFDSLPSVFFWMQQFSRQISYLEARSYHEVQLRRMVGKGLF